MLATPRSPSQRIGPLTELIIPLGLCQCGCGMPTQVAKKSNLRWGHVKGQPVDFVKGHNNRRTPFPYIVEDRGYKTPCWVWQWHLDEDGYGRVYSLGTAHKAFYVAKYGPVPDELVLHHLCRVRACCNPDHLTPVTSAVNAQDSAKAKLDWTKVGEIRAKFKSGNYSKKALSKEYGVTRKTIRLVVLEEIWKAA